MKNLVTKKGVLIISSMGVLILLCLIFSWEIKLCPQDNYTCADRSDKFAETLFVFLPLFVGSLVTYKMNDIVYQSWLNLVLWWIPITLILVLITPDEHDWMFPIASRGGISFLSSGLLLFVTLVLIAYKSFASRK